MQISTMFFVVLRNSLYNMQLVIETPIVGVSTLNRLFLFQTLFRLADE